MKTSKSLALATVLAPCALALAVVTLSMPAAGNAAAPVVTGDYLEARNCDVWTGPCFANGEMNLRGDHAVVAWAVKEGAWNGVVLDGLRIVAVLDAEGTLHTSSEGKVNAVVYVDDAASEEQGKALLDMAVALAPKYLKNILKIERRTITYARTGRDTGLRVGDKAEVKLRTMALSSHCDSICGNEGSFYPSISTGVDVDCAKTLEHAYSGDGLNGVRWSDPNKRSAMVGHFSL